MYHQTSLRQVISSRCHGHRNIMRPCDYTESLFLGREGSGEKYLIILLRRLFLSKK